jgi:hypothetical protein
LDFPHLPWAILCHGLPRASSGFNFVICCYLLGLACLFNYFLKRFQLFQKKTICSRNVGQGLDENLMKLFGGFYGDETCFTSKSQVKPEFHQHFPVIKLLGGIFR